MEAPAITHSSGCVCSDCQWSGSPTVDTRACLDSGIHVNTTKTRETSFLSVLNDNAWLFVIAAVILCLYFIMSKPRVDVMYTEFHQDLNGFSMKLAPGVPIDPKVIAAVKNWQKYPFGTGPRENMVSSIVSGLRHSFTILLLIVVLFVYVCHNP
uniref:Triple gene block protein 3 n=1 Tax=Peanut clump virus TaxID=28355 RepID=A0A8G1LTY8_9VIRU|nr:triple gene block protein 3 [Peanut clump virus]